MTNMDRMESSDIRQRYDHEGDDGNIVSAILDTCPPLCSEHDHSSGLDCLIVVLRRIYSHSMLDYGTSDYLDMATASEKNPILDHAWHLFGQSNEEVQEATKARKEVSEALEKIQYSDQAPFEELCNSLLMNETFWSHLVFRLSKYPFCPKTGDEINESPDEIARVSLLKLDHVANPDMGLQDIVNNAFGHVHRGGKQAFSRPSHPWIVRLLYQPKSEPQGRLDINGLRSLKLPIWERVKNQPNLSFEEVGKADYTLLAVVRLRPNENAHDYVRTYQIHGANTIAEYEPPSFMSKDWSLKDFPGKYMLFYGQMSGPPSIDDPCRFPEIAPPQKMDMRLFEMVGAQMSREMARIKGRKAAPPSLESRQHAWRQIYGEDVLSEPACGPFEVMFPPNADFGNLFLGEDDNFLSRIHEEFLHGHLKVSWVVRDGVRVIIVGFRDNANIEDRTKLFDLLTLWGRVYEWVKLISNGTDLPLVSYMDAKRSTEAANIRVRTGGHAVVVGATI